MSNILIVDDEQDIAELISDVLTDVGYKTTIANNGYQALDLVKSNKYDLILLNHLNKKNLSLVLKLIFVVKMLTMKHQQQKSLLVISPLIKKTMKLQKMKKR